MIRKLYSREGVMLGTLTYPDRYDRHLLQNGNVRVALVRPLPLYTGKGEAVEETVRTAVIEFYGLAREAVCLYGATLEEIEQFQGFSFAPVRPVSGV
jgi:hypothetical protein